MTERETEIEQQLFSAFAAVHEEMNGYTDAFHAYFDEGNKFALDVWSLKVQAALKKLAVIPRRERLLTNLAKLEKECGIE